MVTFQKHSKNQTKTIKSHPPSENKEKGDYKFAECQTAIVPETPINTEKLVSENIYEIDKKMVDSESEVPPYLSMHASKKYKKQIVEEEKNIYNREMINNLYGRKILIPLGNGIFKLVEKEKPEVRKEEKTIDHITKKSNLDFAISIKNVENPDKFRNPIILEKAINKIFKNANNAYVLKFGDIRIWFNNIQDTENSLTVDTKKVFGKFSCVRRANYNQTKIVVYGLPKNINESEIEEYLKNGNIHCDEIRLVERLNAPSKFKTAFISMPNKEKREEILKRGKIRIGICFFPTKKYEPKSIIQCHRCQSFGHIARICPSKVEVCGFCANNHLTKSCNNIENTKCINCGKNEPSFHKNCEKKKPEKRIKIKINKTNKTKKIEEKNFEKMEKPPKKDLWTKIKEEIDKKLETVIKNLYETFNMKLEILIEKLNQISNSYKGNPIIDNLS